MKSVIKFNLLLLGILVSASAAANNLSADFLKNEIAIAHSEYLQGSPESGRYALKALARILESDNASALNAEVGSNNLSFTYLRLGLLYEKSGNYVEAEASFAKALSLYVGEQADLSQLKLAVLALDKAVLQKRG
jgi:tetratricopeptide (TPR) repeat protein